jgi:hypothetical protein
MPSEKIRLALIRLRGAMVKRADLQALHDLGAIEAELGSLEGQLDVARDALSDVKGELDDALKKVRERDLRRIGRN